MLLVLCHKDLNVATERLKSHFDKAYQWTQDSKMALHSGKSVHMIFKLCNEQPILNALNKSVILHQSTAKYLGVPLDSVLIWKLT